MQPKTVNEKNEFKTVVELIEEPSIQKKKKILNKFNSKYKIKTKETGKIKKKK